ncbi:MAG: copper-binding protein [Rhodobacteraceae bacterium]|nr:MAG: copper-binding protein [Paracoccaceae bacterium]
MKRITTLAAASLLALTGTAHATGGDLASLPEALELKVGTGDNGFGMEPNEFQMQTGQSYRLTVQAVGWHECNWEAPSFFKNTWIRKIEAGNMEIKVAYLYELEMDMDGEVEVFFVPIRPGTYSFGCRGLEDRGMTGTFVVE